MSTLVLYVSMSLDGFIAGPGDDADQAKEAAGDPNVLVHGADLPQPCRRAGAPGVTHLHDRAAA